MPTVHVRSLLPCPVCKATDKTATFGLKAKHRVHQGRSGRGVQAAERRVPLNAGSRYNAGALSKQNYFPFKVNGTGVMPVIFASSLLAVPPAIIKFGGLGGLSGAATAVAPGGALYLPLSVALIAVINQFYTFLQFDPNDIADNLKRGVCPSPYSPSPAVLFLLHGLRLPALQTSGACLQKLQPAQRAGT